MHSTTRSYRDKMGVHRFLPYAQSTLIVLLGLNILLIYMNSYHQGLVQPQQSLPTSTQPHVHQSAERKIRNFSPNRTLNKGSQPLMDYLIDTVQTETKGKQYNYTGIYFQAIKRCASGSIKSLLLKEAIINNYTVFNTGKPWSFSR